jgi:large subunit ribosomal protein L30
MSTKQKRKPTPRTARKEKPKLARKRKVTEEKKKEIAPEKKAVVVTPEVSGKPLFLAVRLLGAFGCPAEINSALNGLRLNSRFRGVLLEKSESTMGTLRKVKDYVTWGEVKHQDVATLFKERGELLNGMALTDRFVKESLGHESVTELAQALTRGQLTLRMLREKGVAPVFRLRPPSGGFRMSVKRPFKSYGELGDRGAEISKLVEQMT